MLRKGFVLLCMLFGVYGLFPLLARAESVTVKLSSKESAVTVGESFFVRLDVEAVKGFQKIEGYISYDSEILEYRSADDGISGSGGKLKILAEDLAEEEYTEEYTSDYGVGVENPKAEVVKKSFEIVFKAIKSGKVNIRILKGIKVFSEEDKEMSIYSNSLEIRVKKKREASGIHSLATLEVEDYEMVPEFSKNIYQYRIKVLEEVNELRIKAVPTDENASIKIEGNANFKFGENIVKLSVTSEDGEKSEYEILVLKEEEKKEEAESIEMTEEKKKDLAEEKIEEKSSSVKEEEFIPLSEEPKEKKEEKIENNKDRKNIKFYGIMTAIVVMALLLLRFLWGKLKQFEE